MWFRGCENTVVVESDFSLGFCGGFCRNSVMDFILILEGKHHPGSPKLIEWRFQIWQQKQDSEFSLIVSWRILSQFLPTVERQRTRWSYKVWHTDYVLEKCFPPVLLLILILLTFLSVCESSGFILTLSLSSRVGSVYQQEMCFQGVHCMFHLVKSMSGMLFGQHVLLQFTCNVCTPFLENAFFWSSKIEEKINRPCDSKLVSVDLEHRLKPKSTLNREKKVILIKKVLENIDLKKKVIERFQCLTPINQKQRSVWTYHLIPLHFPLPWTRPSPGPPSVWDFNLVPSDCGNVSSEDSEFTFTIAG